MASNLFQSKKIVGATNSILMVLVVLLISGCSTYTSERVNDAAQYLSLERDPVVDLSNRTITDLVPVGFTARDHEPSDAEVRAMVDEVVLQTLGPQGFAALVKKGDHVILKVNNVGPYIGSVGNKGRAVITDPRIVRHVAESIRNIIGFEAPAELLVCDALFYTDSNPSRTDIKMSFYGARLDRGANSVYYDQNADGILDGDSKARLVNLDGISQQDRYRSQVKNREGRYIDVWFPKIVRTRVEAIEQDGSQNPSQYCDVLIGLPLLKSHGIAGITGALKLQYGFRPMVQSSSESGRFNHSGVTWDLTGMHNQQNLLDFLVAEHLVRNFDFSILDCLTGNRRGPLNPAGGITTVNDDQAVDYLLVNAMAASRDSVACDTLETLLAGYSIQSIGLLETAYQSGIGTNRPVDMLIYGKELFGRHRLWLAQKYGDRYPFADGWGGAKTCNASFLSSMLSASCKFKIVKSRLNTAGNLEIEFELNGLTPTSAPLVRVDLYLADQVQAWQAIASNDLVGQQAGSFRGTFVWKPKATSSGSNQKLSLAIWDAAGNCLSVPVPELVDKN